MPDLTKRSARYATAAVAVGLIATYAYASGGVQLGDDPQVSSLQAENARLAKEFAEAKQRASAAERRAVLAEEEAAKLVAPGATLTCAAFSTREAAQAYWEPRAAQYPDWDGNANGVACEQLRSETPEVVTVTKVVTKTVPARTTEPKAPKQGPAPAVAAAKPTAPSKATIVASRMHFGMYAATTEEYDSVEASLARDTTIHGYFQGFDTDFRPERVNSAWTRGEIPLLTWESRPLSGGTENYKLADIAAGQHDAYLRKYAQAIKANGLPMIIRFDQEMNGAWYRWSEVNEVYGNPPGSYAAAWRHIHDVFQAEGANDLVIWLWAPNRVDNIGNLPGIDRYYPGAAYVDWVGMTGYFRPTDDSPTFSGTYDETLRELRRVAPGKPILLSEVGATERGGHKVSFVRSFFDGLPRNPDVVGFMWFNYTITDNGDTNDWRIQSTTAVLDAFREGLYATGYGRDRGKQPILITAAAAAAPAPTATPTSTPTPTPTQATTRRGQQQAGQQQAGRQAAQQQQQRRRATAAPTLSPTGGPAGDPTPTGTTRSRRTTTPTAPTGATGWWSGTNVNPGNTWQYGYFGTRAGGR